MKQSPKKQKPENLKTKDSSDNNSEEPGDKKSSLFISRCEDEEESKMISISTKQDYDIVSELESKASLTSRGGYHDAIKQLYLGEPKWSKSSSWVKPVPHRVYKIKTIWTEESKFDTEVRRRYSHFAWLRKMLIKEYEACAVPVLPDKSLFERISSHESDFIKERMRKMKHFLTLVRSHRKLQQSDYFKAFLCENDKIFKSTLKNLKLLEESDKSPVVQKTKGWLSVASSSFGKVFTKGNAFNLENLVPGVKNLLSKPDDEYNSGDLLVNKYAEKLEVLKQSFIDLYKLADKIHENRSIECKLERGAYHVMDTSHTFEDKKLQKKVEENTEIAKKRGDIAYNNLVELKDLLYATESHLVWIESVQDLIERKNELCEKLLKIKNDMKNSPLNHHEIESCKYLLSLTERRDIMIKGIRKEMEKLRIGTRDFYPRYINTGFIVSQLKYYQKSCDFYVS